MNNVFEEAARHLQQVLPDRPNSFDPGFLEKLRKAKINDEALIRVSPQHTNQAGIDRLGLPEFGRTAVGGERRSRPHGCNNQVLPGQSRGRLGVGVPAWLRRHSHHPRAPYRGQRHADEADGVHAPFPNEQPGPTARVRVRTAWTAESCKCLNAIGCYSVACACRF